MARYSLFVLKVLLNSKQTNKQTSWPVTVEQACTSSQSMHVRLTQPAICGQMWCAEMRRAETTCAETRLPVSQCCHTLQKLEKTKMSVLLKKND